MNFRVILERHAEEDFTEHTDYIARDNPAAALDFIKAVEQALARLADMPEIGSSRPFRHSRLEGIRMWSVPQFQNYLVFYRVTSAVRRAIPTSPRRAATWRLDRR